MNNQKPYPAIYLHGNNPNISWVNCFHKRVVKFIAIGSEVRYDRPKIIGD